MKRESGSTLIFTITVLGLLASLAAVLAAPLSLTSRRLDLYYARVQARELSRAGLARAAAQKNVEGNVSVTMHALPDGRIRVVSTGRVRLPWRAELVAEQTETILSFR